MGIADKLIICPGIVRSHLVDRLPFVTARGVVVSTIGGNNSHRSLRREVHIRSVTTTRIIGTRNNGGSLVSHVTTSPTFVVAGRRVLTIVGPRGCINETPRRATSFLGRIVGPVLSTRGSLLNVSIRVGI